MWRSQSSCSPAATLNRPKNVLEDGRSNHVLRIFQIIPAGPQRFISPGQGAGPGSSQGSSRIPPTPHRVYKGEAEGEEPIQFSAHTDHPPPFLYEKDEKRPAGGHHGSWDATWHISALPLYHALFAIITFSSLFQEGCLSWPQCTKPSVAI